jgi:hypothetical protein
MRTPEFARGVGLLLERAALAPTAAMCAEADWHHCHRGLLADAVVLAGDVVVHLIDRERVEPHVLHPAAVVGPEGLTYSSRQGRIKGL